MTGFVTALRWDVVVQARNGFYWATAFLVLAVGGLLRALPEAARADQAAWVPALQAGNLPITTFFFVAGLILLERDEGTLAALAVTPLSAAAYLASRTVTLTALATLETVAIIWIAFGMRGSWLLLLAGTVALGAMYTGFGAALTTRYGSVNKLLLPAAVIVAALLLPLLPHFGLAPRAPFFLHPIEPPLTLLRAAYLPAGIGELAYGLCGSVAWCAVAFLWGERRIRRLIRDTQAGGGK